MKNEKRTYTLTTSTGERFTIQARSPYGAIRDWVTTHDITSASGAVTTPGSHVGSFDVTDGSISTATRPRRDSSCSLPPLDLLLATP